MSNIANLDKFGKFISLRNPKSNAQTVIRFYNYFIVFFLPIIVWVKAHFSNFFLTDPFADAAKGDESGVQDGLVHIRIQQRSGRKTLTTIQGLSSEYDLKKIVRACKKVIKTRKHFHSNKYVRLIYFLFRNLHAMVPWSNIQNTVKSCNYKVINAPKFVAGLRKQVLCVAINWKFMVSKCNAHFSINIVHHQNPSFPNR